MHVVHVYDGHEQVHEGRGSVPNVVWNVARETATHGHDVTVVERRWRGLAERATHDGVRFERLALRTGADDSWEDVPYEMVESQTGIARLVLDRTNFAIAALRRLRTLDADVVHVHLPFAANVLVFIAPWLRSRMVYTAHLGELRMNALADDQVGPNEDQEGPKDDASAAESDADDGDARRLEVPDVLRYRSPDTFLARRVAHTTVLNADIESVFVEQGVPAETVSVVPNGVDVARFSEVEADRLAAVRKAYVAGSPVLLFVGTVMPRKGVDVLVRAAAALKDLPDYEDLQVIVAGEDELDGEYTREVRDLAAELGVSDAITFAGFVDAEDLPALYAVADVFVLPSREEGFGMTVLEALAAGTPVVATHVGGVPDLVDDGEEGYLVAPNDTDGIIMGIKKIVDSDRSRDEFATQAIRRAREYDWPRIASRFVDVYEEVGCDEER